MNIWIRVFLSGFVFMHLSTSFAVPMDDIEMSKAQASERVGNIFSEWEKQRIKAAVSEKVSSAQQIEQQQMRTIKNILKHSRLFAMMLILEEETPSIAKQLSSMSVLYEMKAINQTLSQMFSEMKKNNQLIKQIDLPRITSHCNALANWKNNE